MLETIYVLIFCKRFDFTAIFTMQNKVNVLLHPWLSAALDLGIQKWRICNIKNKSNYECWKNLEQCFYAFINFVKTYIYGRYSLFIFYLFSYWNIFAWNFFLHTFSNPTFNEQRSVKCFIVCLTHKIETRWPSYRYLQPLYRLFCV